MTRRGGVEVPGEGFAEYGSWNYHKHPTSHGSFVRAAMEAIKLADDVNVERLRLAFPQLVAAKQERDWNKAPEGFIHGDYNEDRQV